MFELQGHVIGEGFDVSIGCARANQHVVGDVGLVPYIQDDDIPAFQVIQCLEGGVFDLLGIH